MNKNQKNNIESRMWEVRRRIDQLERRIENMPDRIAEAEEEGDTEFADELRLRCERRIEYLHDKRYEYEGMLTIVEILGYRVSITLDDDGRPTDLTLEPSAV